MERVAPEPCSTSVPITDAEREVQSSNTRGFLQDSHGNSHVSRHVPAVFDLQLELFSSYKDGFYSAHTPPRREKRQGREGEERRERKRETTTKRQGKK